MKKVLSVTLAAVLLFTAFVTVFSFNAAAESVELLGNGNFNGTAGERVPWQQVDNSAEKNAAFVYAEEAGRQFASGKAGSAVFKQVTLKANVSYTVSFEARFLGETVPDSFNSFYRAGFAAKVSALGNSNFVGPNSTGNKYYSIYDKQLSKVKAGTIANVSAWGVHSFTFTPAADLTTYFVLGSYDSSCKATLEVDNAFICKTEDLVTVTAKAGQGGSVLGGGVTFKGNKVTLTAVPNTGYELFGWFNSSSEKLGSALSLEVTAAEDLTVTAQFAASAAAADFIAGGDFNTGLANTFSVRKQGTAANFEQEPVQEGDLCLKGAAGLSIYAPVTLKAGTEYTMTFDTKFSGAEVPAAYESFYRAGFVKKVDYLSGSAFENGSYYSFYAKQKSNPFAWQTHTVTFTPLADFTGYAVIGTVDNLAAAAYYLDNWHLAKTADYKTVTLTAERGGSVSGGKKVIAGNAVTVLAVAQTGYRFAGWFENGVKKSNSESYTFTVTNNVALTAKFESNGTTAENLLQNGDFESGLKVEKIFDTADKANAQTVMKNNAGKWGRLFSGVTVMELVGEANFTEGDSAAQNGTAYLKTGTTADGKYIRGFGQFVYLEKGDYVLQFTAKNNSNYLKFGVWSSGSLIQNEKDITVLCSPVPQSQSWAAHSVKFTAANSGYYQIGFGGNAQDVPGAVLCLDNIALYSTQSFVTVTAKAGQGGSVSGSTSVLKGQQVTVTATPAAGYSFVGWQANGATVSTSLAYTFTPSADVTLTAIFKKNAEFGDNLLENGDFETPLDNIERIFNNSDEAAAQEKMAANAGKWGRLYSTVTRMESVTAAGFEAADSAEYNGTRYLKSGATADGFVRGFGQFVQLTPGNYTLSFIARSNTAGYFAAGVWGTGTVVPEKAGTEKLASIRLAASENWLRYSLNFTVTAAGYYQVGFGQNGSRAGAEFCLDNVLLCKTEKFVGITVSTAGGGSVSGPLNLVKAGDSVTIKAVPDENYSFVGWFLNGALVTAEPSYTFTVTGSAEYVAKFNLNLGLNDIVQNGDFEYNSGSLLGWETVKLNGEGVTLVTDSDTGSHAAKISGGGILAQRASFKKGEKYVISFDAKFTDFSMIPEAYQSFYRSGLTTDLNSLNNSSFIGPGSTGNKYVSIFEKNKAADNNWHTYTYSYDSLNDLDCWLVFGCVSNLAKSGILFDNIVVYNAKSANELQLFAVSAGGSGTVSSNLTGYLKSGTVVQLTAEANKGSVFGGWYQNGKLLSTANPFTYTCNSSEAVYAKFFNAKEGKESMQAMANSNFEDGFTSWNFKNIEGLKNSSTLQKDGSTNYVRLGRSDMLSQTVELQNGYTYRVSVVSRADPKNVSASNSFSYLRFAVAKPGAGTTLFADALDAGDPDAVNSSDGHTQRLLYDYKLSGSERRESLKQFNTYVYDIGNYTGKTMLADIVVGIPYYLFPGDLEVASITISRFSLGISNYEPVNLYGEDFYNNVANAGFSNKTDNADWGSSLPAGWQIKKEKGNNYLSVQSNTKTYGFSVYPGAVHLVSLSMRTKSAGNSRVEIVDAAGNVLGDCIQIDPRKAVLQPKTNNSWQRVGMEVYVPFNVDRIYLRIIGANNVLDLDDVTVVRNRNATLKNMNIASMANYNYNTAKYYNPTLYYTADGANTAEGENAATGEGAFPVIPLAATVVTTALLLLVLKPKKNKGEVK